MTKKKLNNLLNFLIFALPILSLLIFSAVKFFNSNGYEETGLSGFFNTFINSFNNFPLFNQLANIIELIFNVDLGPVNVIVLYLIALIIYLILASICIIIKDLLLLLINICNKYIFIND